MENTLHFIVNTHSRTGKAKAIWERLETILLESGADYRAHITEYVHHATDLVAELTAGDEHVSLIVCGGDGTVNEAINGIRDLSKVTFGYIPLGSANDFARGLGITDEPEDILKQILQSKEEQAIDLGLVSWDGGSRRFAISAGAGVDAAVCRKALTSKLKVFLNKLHLGSLTYGILAVVSVLQAPFVQGEVTTQSGERISLKKAIFTAAMNFSCEGGGVPMVPEADARDGKLSVCCVSDIPRLMTLICFVQLLAFKHEKIKGYQVIHTEEMNVRFDKPMVVHADGEDCGDQTHVQFKALPQALHMPVL